MESASAADYINLLLEQASSSLHSGVRMIDATNFNERERNLKIVPIGIDGAQYYLELMPPELQQQYQDSGLPQLPIQAQPNFNGLSGLRNLFSIFPENIKSHPVIKNIAHHLENLYQQIYQEQRLKEEEKQIEEIGKFFPDPTVSCLPVIKPVPNRLPELVFGIQSLQNLKRYKYTGEKQTNLELTDELVFKEREVEQLLALPLYRHGSAIRRSIMDFDNLKKRGKTIELLYQIMIYGFDRMYTIFTSRQWETRGQILEFVPANKSPRMLADVNIEQLLYVPKLEKSATPCPKCGSENNSQVTFQTRAADEPLTTKIICGNPHCRKVWHEEG